MHGLNESSVNNLRPHMTHVGGKWHYVSQIFSWMKMARMEEPHNPVLFGFDFRYAVQVVGPTTMHIYQWKGGQMKSFTCGQGGDEESAPPYYPSPRLKSIKDSKCPGMDSWICHSFHMYTWFSLSMFLGSLSHDVGFLFPCVCALLGSSRLSWGYTQKIFQNSSFHNACGRGCGVLENLWI